MPSEPSFNNKLCASYKLADALEIRANAMALNILSMFSLNK